MSRGAVDSHVASGGICGGGGGDSCGVAEIMLFGVRVTVDSMRKSVSMNNLSQYEHPNGESGGNNTCGGDVVVAAGYASADDVVHHSSSGRERKRGIPWTEDEHKMFLVGLQKVGKGDWRGISKNFVKTRTPTQVASHAQKYFLRRSNLNRRRRRSSLFDMTTDSVTQMEEDQVNHQDKISQQQMPILESCNTNKFPAVPTFPMPIAQVVLPAPIENPTENLTLGQGDQTKDFTAKLIPPIPVLPLLPAPTTTTDLTLNLRSADPSPLSLKLSLSTNQNQTTRHSLPFHTMSSFNNGDSMISVA